MKIIDCNSSTLPQIIDEVCRVLASGGLVVYPTETCYGLAADATNLSAVEKLLSYKRRREGKPLSILVPNQEIASKYVEINPSADRLYKTFLPGPMTVVSKVLPDKIATGVASELGTLGVRISSHPVAMAIAQAYGKPVTATSANASWKKKPYAIADILEPISDDRKQKLDLLLDYGELPHREASTVVDTTLLGNMIMRQGDLTPSEVQESFETTSTDQTQDLAKRLMLKNWNPLRQQGCLWLLCGDLGMGKTVFSQGVGAFLGIPEKVKSPSYILVNEYDYLRHGVLGKFFHLDPWRLETFDQLLDLGLKDMLKPNNFVVIEWANKFTTDFKLLAKTLGVACLYITFSSSGDTQRTISISEI